MNRIIKTEDGSHTIYVPELEEHYHSVHGAIQESDHVFIKNGLAYCKSDPVNILEVGFGTGLNVLLTAVHNQGCQRIIYYTAIEKYPLPGDMVRMLNYPDFLSSEARDIFTRIHMSDWETMNSISPNLFLKKIKLDMINDPVEGKFNLIYFDAFGPDKQPEMWTSEIIQKIAGASCNDALFVTYSAKGELKRNLRACGFNVYILPGPPGKRHITRAVRT